MSTSQGDTRREMVKLVALYGAPADTEHFERYYAQTHMPLALAIPGLAKVETARILGSADGGAAPFYRIAELWFADTASLNAGAASREGQAALADLAAFATGGVSLFVAAVDAEST